MATTKTPDADLYNVSDADGLLRAGTEPSNFAPEKLAVPEIAQSVYVRRISAAELDEYAHTVGDAEDAETRATILAHALGDFTGHRLYTTPEQMQALKGFNAKAAQRVVRHFQAINGLTGGDAAKK